MTTWLPIFLSLMAAVLAPFSALATLLLLPALLVTSLYARIWVQGALAWLMLGWMFWLPITLVSSQSPGLALPQASVLLCLPLAWIAGMALQTRNQLNRVINYGLPTILILLIIWGLLQGSNTFTLKPQGPFNDPNTYVALLNLLSLPLLARYLADDLAVLPRWRRTGMLALLASTAFTAFLVSSRGATLALILVTPPLLWLARSQPAFVRKLLLLASVTLVSFLAALSISNDLTVAQRLIETVQGGDPYRIMLMRSAWLMIMDHPWLGTGLGSFRLLYPQYRFPEETISGSGWVHNDYLQLWLEAGLPMFLLMLGLVLWVALAGWRTLRQGGQEALLRMGYIAAIAAILLHALVNFLFFFSLVSLLVGLYLAQISQVNLPSTPKAEQKNVRAMRMATGGYVFLLGYLLVGQVAVEGLLGEARSIQRTLWKWHIPYPRYEVAYWVSILAPFHPSPQQIMGLELSDSSLFGGGTGTTIRNDALDRMEAAWKLAPCYLPYANDALAVIRNEPLNDAMRARGRAIAERNLDCNTRHGLSYYHIGGLTRSESDTMMWWRAGLAASPWPGDRLLLATAILSQTTPSHEQELTALAAQMAQAIRSMEANPSIHNDQTFWIDAQHKLWRIAGLRFLELVPPERKLPVTSAPSKSRATTEVHS